MKRIILLSGLCVSFLFIACKKEDPEEPYFPEGKIPELALEYTYKEGLLPSKWVYRVDWPDNAQQWTTEFLYDDKNRITDIVTRWEYVKEPGSRQAIPRTSEVPPKSTERHFVYHVKGYLVREEFSEESRPTLTVLYAYEDDVVWKKEHYLGLESDSYVFMKQVDAAGRVALESDHTGSYTVKYHYDQTGNVTRYQYSDQGATWEFGYTYDDKKGVFSSVNTPLWRLATYDWYGYLYNNKITHTLSDEKVHRIAYEYNELGYPVLITYPDSQYSYEETVRIEYIPATVF